MLANLLGRKRGLSSLLAKPYLKRYFNFTGDKSRMFVPNRKLIFDKNNLLLVSKSPMNSFYLFCAASGGIILILCGMSLYKIVRINQRSFLGFLYYLTLFGVTSFLLYSCHMSMREVITKVWLKSCGKRVLIQRGFPYLRPEEVLISEISKPDNIPAEFAMSQFANLGFPVIVQGEGLVMPKSTQRIHQDVFGAIFSGLNIQVNNPQEQDNDIIIS